MIAPYKPIKVGEDSRKNWPRINEAGALIRELDRRLAPLESALFRRLLTTGGDLQTLRVKEVPSLEEYIVCRTWDGTTEGDEDIIVAKHFDARQPASEYLNGVLHSYSYSSFNAFNDQRESDNGTDVETQIVVPHWQENGLILVARTNFSGVMFDDTINPPSDLKLIEVSPRCWAKMEGV